MGARDSGPSFRPPLDSLHPSLAGSGIPGAANPNSVVSEGGRKHRHHHHQQISRTVALKTTRGQASLSAPRALRTRNSSSRLEGEIRSFQIALIDARNYGFSIGLNGPDCALCRLYVARGITPEQLAGLLGVTFAFQFYEPICREFYQLSG